jgi:hypothetical protein
LKKRGEAAEGRREGDGPAFIEFPPALAAVQECVIDLEDGAMSLRVQLKGYSAAEIATVGRSVRDTR